MYLDAQEQLHLKGIRNKFSPGVLGAGMEGILSAVVAVAVFLEFCYTYMMASLCR